ncbi:hypothetical protein Cpir12675_005542 [Ceratocystis pirilliformis]|uniref:cAMP-dependent protein kinase regulatory subunit n=1 Tax=Ceratocystis pirilliformis TaxID=259994 RepID=A0ABR3YP10_9PEZI
MHTAKPALNAPNYTTQAQARYSSKLDPPTMILPDAYRREIQALENQFWASNPTDVVQFCADFFTARLAAERASIRSISARNSPRSGTPDITSESFDSFASYKMSNTFSNPFATGANPFDSTPKFEPSSYGSSNDNAMQLIEEEASDDIRAPPASSIRSLGASGAFRSPFAAFDGPDSSNLHKGSGLPSQYNLGRRTSVSAESLKPSTGSEDNWSPPFHKKTPEQLERLKKSIQDNFLFSHLDDEQSNQILGALVEKPIPAKDIKVISQGDAGDFFYVVEKGNFAVYVNSTGSLQPGMDGMGTKVNEIGPGGSFGELALMYNAPRAATIVSVESGCLLWALDRITFRRILMESTFSKRRMYETFLGEVPLLSSLTPYERSKIADALEQERFSAGQSIITEGDFGQTFYIVESGEADALKGDTIVKNYKKGEFFGELALLNDAPRAATVVARTNTKVVSLGKSAFQRLLGPVEGIMRRTQYVGIASGVEEMDPLQKH